MSDKPSIKKNFMYSTAYQILMIIIPLFTGPYLARVLGADKLGIQSYTASVQSYFLNFAALGTQTYGAREISRHRDDNAAYSKLFWEIELVSVITSTISLLGWFILICCSSDNRIYYIAMIPNLIGSLLNITWLFNGLEKFKLTVMRNAIFQLAGVLLMFVLVRSKEDLLAYVLILSISNLLSNMSLWIYVPQLIKRVKINELKLFVHFRQTLLYFIPTIATSIYNMLDKTLIGLITEDSYQNGYYDQAEKIIKLAKTVSFTSLNSVVGVRISYLFENNKIEEIHNRINYSLNFILFMCIGSGFGIAAIAKDFVPLFYGPGYDPVVVMLYILCPIIVIIGMSHCMGSHYYTPSGRRAQSTKYLISGSVLNFCTNMVLIPKFGANGAAVASVMAELLITILYVKNCNGFATFGQIFRLGFKKIIAGIVMLFIVTLISRCCLLRGWLLIICEVAIGATSYILTLLLLRDRWVFAFIKDNVLSKIKK